MENIMIIVISIIEFEEGNIIIIMLNERNWRVIVDEKWIDISIQGEWMNINEYQVKCQWEKESTCIKKNVWGFLGYFFYMGNIK